MQDVDQALARLYDRRDRRPAPASDPQRRSAPGPHFAMDSKGQTRDSGGSFDDEVVWPETVRELERVHGRRFAELAGHLEAWHRDHQMRVILVTSCHRAEGRTTLVLATARALAQTNLRVAILDGDLTGPMLATTLGLRPRFGLDDVVERDIVLDEVIRTTRSPRLAIVPLRRPVERPRDFLESPQWSCTMARLRRTYDLVLIDGSPLFTGLNATVLHNSVDGAIVVRHRDLTGERGIRRASEVLEAAGVPLLGLAETFV